MIKKVQKPWGYEIIWAHTGNYAGKVLFIKAGEQLSLQYHKKKDEAIYVLEGRLKLEIIEDGKGNIIEMNEGESYRIPPNTKHRMAGISDCKLCEVSTSELDDVVRLEDRYGRV